MKAALTNKYDVKITECETASIKIDDIDVVITDEHVRVYRNDFIVFQLMVIEPVSEPIKIYKSERYKPESKKMSIPPVTVFFNSWFDNWVKSIKSWRDLLK